MFECGGGAAEEEVNFVKKITKCVHLLRPPHSRLF